MADRFNFIEVDSKNQCWYCGRRKLAQNEKFYKVFAGTTDLGILVCELCRDGFLIRIFEGSEKTYAAHLIFHIRRSLLEFKNRLPEKVTTELISAIENYENGRYSGSFRNIGYVAEELTMGLFTKKFNDTKAKLSWEDKLGRLLAESKKNNNVSDEVLMYQLFSLKWFRNKAAHPSKYEISGEDARLGLVSIMYILNQCYSQNLF